LKTVGSGANLSQHFSPLPLKISAHSNRVAVLDGHTMCLSLRLKKKATPQQIKDILRDYTSEAQHLNLPSSPNTPIRVFEERDRPQPRLDREAGQGYIVSVGRVRPGNAPSDIDSSFDIRLVCLVHNTVLGAAGGALINAEFAKARKIL